MNTEFIPAPDQCANSNRTASPPAPHRPMSRQRRWQLKMMAEQRCLKCGLPAVGRMCGFHLAQERERQRRINGYVSRRHHALSYMLEGAHQTELA